METRLSAPKKIESTRIFTRAEAFYDYLESLLLAEGYVLVETCPRLDENKSRKDMPAEGENQFSRG